MRYNEYHATIDINTGLVTGCMPRNAMRLVYEWLDLHRDELLENWNRMENGETLATIKPLINMETQNSLKWVTSARTMDDYKLELTFNDGLRRIFDCSPLIERYKLFAPLCDKEVFNHIALDGWTVTWLDGTIDIAPEHLYEMSVSV